VTGEYLWDRSGWPDPEVERLERLLGALRYRPKPLPAHVTAPRTSPRAVIVSLALAASLVAAIGLTWWALALRTTGPSLHVRRLEGTPTVQSRPLEGSGSLPVGGWLETGRGARAAVDMTSVGRVEIDQNTRLRLVTTKPGAHQMHLSRGTMHAIIWAPPGQFSVTTPTSTAVDLGCIYTMTMDEEGTGLLRVAAGWVGFEWRGRESFIPAGAACVTRQGLGPGTPHYEDTSPAFRTALSTIDEGRATAAARSAALTLVLDEARSQDVLTLWHLLSRVEPSERDRVFDKLATFVPPPATVTREGVREGRRAMLDDWWDALGLETAAWWRIWKQQWRDGPLSR
jgi:hypothetical protein